MNNTILDRNDNAKSKRPRRARNFVALVAVAGLLFAGCSDADETDSAGAAVDDDVAAAANEALRVRPGCVSTMRPTRA